MAKFLRHSVTAGLIGSHLVLLGHVVPVQADELLGHESVIQSERPAADENLQRLKIGDRLWEAGDQKAARAYYQQAKPPFAKESTQTVLEPFSDPEALSPAASVYWRHAQEGLQQQLSSKALISLNLLTTAAPNFIPGRIAEIEELQQEKKLDLAKAALENAMGSYGNSVELMEYAIKFYAGTEQWLDASLVARQFALLNPEHPRHAEFLAAADQYWDKYQGQLRSDLRGNAIANLITGTVGFALTGNIFGPITAIESTALLLQGEDAVGDRISKRIQFVAPMAKEEKVLAYVQEIGDRLTPFLGENRFHYEYHVILDDELNAFSLPGGKLFINAGAILQSKSEAELAGIISHELAHAALSHGFQLITQGNLTANLTSGLPFGRIASSLLTLNYSREMERQADALGTRVLAASPYAADGLYNLTQTLKTQAGDRPLNISWFADHPNTDERIQNIETQIVQNNYDRYRFEGVRRHQDIQKIVQKLMDAEKAKEKTEESE